jgi:hypothetical protein
MRVRIKRKNLPRLASLSALGAGALTLVAGTAEADIVDVNVNQTYSVLLPGPPIEVFLPGATGISPNMLLGATAGPSHHTFTWKHRTPTGHGGTKVTSGTSPHGGLVRNGRNRSGVEMFFQGITRASGPVSRGALAGSPLDNVQTVIALYNTYFRSVKTSNGQVKRFQSGGVSTKFNDKYFLFRFQDNGKTLHGWGQLEVTTFAGPPALAVTFVDYAYDTTGALLPAGDTGVPEPSEMLPLALSALVLGAAGVRRWRAAKAA